MYMFLLRTKANMADIIDILFLVSFLGLYIGLYIYIYFISPKLNKKYFEKLRKEMEENERTKNSPK